METRILITTSERNRLESALESSNGVIRSILTGTTKNIYGDNNWEYLRDLDSRLKELRAILGSTM